MHTNNGLINAGAHHITAFQSASTPLTFYFSLSESACRQRLLNDYGCLVFLVPIVLIATFLHNTHKTTTGNSTKLQMAPMRHLIAFDLLLMLPLYLNSVPSSSTQRWPAPSGTDKKKNWAQHSWPICIVDFPDRFFLISSSPVHFFSGQIDRSNWGWRGQRRTREEKVTAEAYLNECRLTLF